MHVILKFFFEKFVFNRLKNWASVFFLFVGLFFFATSHVQAQSVSKLRVLINSNEDGGPIIGANVFILNTDNGQIIKSGATNNDGFIEFGQLQPGDYNLKATYIGYKNYERVIHVFPGKTKIKHISLIVQVAELGELTVETRRNITTGEAGVRRISKVDIARIPSPIAGGDLASYLQSVPGVISNGDRGGELHIRGGTPTQNRVLVDNLPIIKPFHISNLFSAFPDKTVQNVDLYAGGFGAEYYDATSAIINVNLRPGNLKEFSGSGSISPYVSSLEIEGPFEKDRKSFLLMGRKSLINQTAPDLTGQDTDLDFYDITARYSYRGDSYNCNLTGIRTFDSGEINPARNINLSYSNTVVGGRCIGFSPDFDHPIKLTGGYSSYINTTGSPGSTEQYSRVNQFFFGYDHYQKISETPIHYGLDVNYRFFKARIAERFTSIESFSSQRPAVHIYISTVLDPNKYFTIEPSIGSAATFFTGPTFEPRLRVAYRPDGSNQQEISLALGRYTQSSSGITDQRDAGTAFTVLKPDEENGGIFPTALHAIVGYHQLWGRHLKTKIEGYVKSQKNIPVSKFNPTARLEIETAPADGLSYGLDIFAEYSKNPFYFSIGYGYAEVNYEASSKDLGSFVGGTIFKYSPRQDQRHKLNTVASYTFAGFTGNVRWEFGSGKPYTQVFGFDLALDLPDQSPVSDPGTARTLFTRPYNKRLPTYHRLDISVKRSFQLTPAFAMDVQAGAINTYDRSNIFYFDANSQQRIDQSPLLPYISLKAQFN